MTHVVTFDTAGGSEVASQQVEDGQCAKRPGAPTLDGFEFEGWCLADGADYDFSAPVTTDLALYARWSAKGDPAIAHLVVFETNGGSEVASQVIGDGRCATRPVDDPTRDGYEFAGWYADETLAEEFDFAKAITADVTVYAKWEAVSPDPEPTPDTDTDDGDDQPGGSGKALPSTGDLGSVAALASAAVAGLGALTVGLRRRK